MQLLIKQQRLMPCGQETRHVVEIIPIEVPEEWDSKEKDSNKIY